MQKSLKVVSLGIGLTLTLGSVVYADQCAYTSKQQAIAALSLLEEGQIIYELCEPCGDTVPKAVKINSVSAGTVGYESFWGVKVNNSNIDLAYTYIDDRNNKNRKVNLANLASCPASDVSSTIFLSKQR
ncbi:MAG: hypothetical protein KME01_16650 [Chroococcus sp. CMT-3BRIN-NPC107]|nr:hypothetical protein [Chroococcus sp. CMT-3BRIN-NPC107]